MKRFHLYGFGPDYDLYDVRIAQTIDIGDFDSYEEAAKIGEEKVKEGVLSEYEIYDITRRLISS